MKISEIVKKYRGEKSLREFAADISKGLPGPITYQTIKYWEDDIYKPSKYLMLAIALHNKDWRRQMALEILAVMDPDYQPDLEDLCKKGNGNE